MASQYTLGLRRPTRSVSHPPTAPRSCHLATILEDLELRDGSSLNLGAESLSATPKTSYSSEEAAYVQHALSLVQRTRTRKFDPEAKKSKLASSSVDRDCAICFGQAIRPSRTRCCGKLFCEAHLHDWLSASSNRCPTCRATCTTESGVISLASPASPTSLSPVEEKNNIVVRPRAHHSNSDDQYSSSSGSSFTSSSLSTPSWFDENATEDDPSDANSSLDSVGRHQPTSDPSWIVDYPTSDFRHLIDVGLELPSSALASYKGIKINIAFASATGKVLNIVALTLVLYVLLS